MHRQVSSLFGKWGEEKCIDDGSRKHPVSRKKKKKKEALSSLDSLSLFNPNVKPNLHPKEIFSRFVFWPNFRTLFFPQNSLISGLDQFVQRASIICYCSSGVDWLIAFFPLSGLLPPFSRIDDRETDLLIGLLFKPRRRRRRRRQTKQRYPAPF